METENQRRELEKQISLYQADKEPYDLKDKTVILADDGCYSGSTIIAASKWIRAQSPNIIIAALPVIPKESYHLLSKHVDSIEFIRRPNKFKSVEDHYQDFSPVLDSKIIGILKQRDMHL
jgi:putative phosphoribosyl transferase